MACAPRCCGPCTWQVRRIKQWQIGVITTIATSIASVLFAAMNLLFTVVYDQAI